MKEAIAKAAILSSVVFIQSSCCGHGGAIPYNVAGFRQAFPFPRSDIQPGTIIARFRDGSVLPVCIKGKDFAGGGQVTRNPAYAVTSTEEQSFTAKLGLDVKSVVEAKLGSKAVRKVSVTADVTPLTDSDPITTARDAQAATACTEKAKFAREQYGESLEYFSVIESVAEISITYQVELDSVPVAGDVSLNREITDTLGFTPTLTGEVKSSSVFKIEGQRLVQQYTPNDAIVPF